MPTEEPPTEPAARPLPEPPAPLASSTTPATGPNGWVVGTGAEPLASTRGVGSVAIALFWTAVGARVLTAAAVFHRKALVDGFINGDFGHRRPRSQDHDARALINVARSVQLGLGVAAAIVVAVWCRRVVLNARRRGVSGLSPTRATVGWFIPYLWWTMGFRQLRLVLTAWDENRRPLAAWQGTVFVSSVFAVFTRGDGGRIRDLVSLSGSLDHLGLLTLGSAAILAVAAYKASQVIRQFDRAFSPG
jgi:hypothetical protein